MHLGLTRLPPFLSRFGPDDMEPFGESGEHMVAGLPRRLPQVWDHADDADFREARMMKEAGRVQARLIALYPRYRWPILVSRQLQGTYRLRSSFVSISNSMVAA